MMHRTISLKISKVLMREFSNLTPPERDLVVAFLKRLQDDPFEETLISNAEAHEDIFASTVGRRYLYWTVEAGPEGGDRRDTGDITVKVLGLERALWRRRYRSKKGGALHSLPLLKDFAGSR
jgi:hypothetical protein